MARHEQARLKLDKRDQPMNTNHPNEEASATPAPAAFVQPNCTFGQVLTIVSGVEGLTPGVRQNLQGAVIRCAKLMSSAGLRAVVDVPSIAKRLGKALPCPAWVSRTEAALRPSKVIFAVLCGSPASAITPARHTTPLSPEWRALQARIDDPSIRRQLSRFMHVASEQGWLPSEINDTHSLAVSAAPVLNLPEK